MGRNVTSCLYVRSGEGRAETSWSPVASRGLAWAAPERTLLQAADGELSGFISGRAPRFSLAFAQRRLWCWIAVEPFRGPRAPLGTTAPVHGPPPGPALATEAVVSLRVCLARLGPAKEDSCVGGTEARENAPRNPRVLDSGGPG